MPWVTIADGRYWVGEHKDLGLVVFDREDSVVQGCDSVVMLYVMKDDRWEIFDKLEVKASLRPGWVVQKKYKLEKLKYAAQKAIERLGVELGWGEGSCMYSRTETPSTRAYDPTSGMHNVEIFSEVLNK